MASVELLLVVIAIVVQLLLGSRDGVAAFPIIGLLAAAMGVQSATTSRLQMPGFHSTVVLTTMIGTMAASTPIAGGTGADNGRRLAAVSCMLLGGLMGALLALHASLTATLGLAAVMLIAANGGALRAHRAGFAFKIWSRRADSNR